MWPARQLAGDFYDVLELPDGRLGVLIADVSGKGVPAAFFMGISRTVLRSAAREGQSPGTCLALANDALCRTNPMDLFVTVFYGILNPRDGTFFYANGGHTSPLLVRDGAGAPVPLEGTGSFVLGGLEGIPYPERSVQLEPGDAVLLYTDGVTEAQNAAGEAFAEARLIRAAGETRGLDPGAMATHVTEAVRAFTGSAAPADDLTCLVLCYLGARDGS
jgi:sigma-B regulation protein RsbU (phosphoserine phosphatase)